MTLSRFGIGAALLTAGLVSGAAFGPSLGSAAIPTTERVLLSGCGQSLAGTGTITGVNVSMTRRSSRKAVKFTVSSGVRTAWAGVTPAGEVNTIDVSFLNGVVLTDGVRVDTSFSDGAVCRVYGDGFGAG